MKNITYLFFLVFSALFCSNTFAETPLSDKYREPDLSFSAYNIDDNYYASFSGSINVDEHIAIDATLDSSGYLELGVAYGDLIFDIAYAEGYFNYGRTDTTDIYTIGMFAGLPLNENLMIFANTAYDWRRTQDNIAGAGNWGLFDEDEWKNTLGVSYSIHQWVSLSSTYSIDYLTDSPNQVDDNVATSWDATITFNTPWLSPYVKYSKGNYRVTPEQQRKSQDNVEIGLNFNF
ncbi:hypothetical protein FR932_13040 [Moritella marina ATCC 15381]|uniref:Porin n=1 Tax=Moritella marina ATCC 15381 TaxID=1202962 RepID=A0A5J6WN49_MORMI|nr:hypothetical protein [Moritella marina]QFI38711.1 hypothetical protein FR932_13040 [Moritella marina ATCC 15381]